MITICIAAATTTIINENTTVTLTIGGGLFILYYVAQFVKRFALMEKEIENNTRALQELDKEVKAHHDKFLKCVTCRRANGSGGKVGGGEKDENN